MKTIIVIESCDTKHQEAAYLKGIIEEAGLRCIVMDTSTGPGKSIGADISREEIVSFAGREWPELEPLSKGEKISFMQKAVALSVRDLFEKGRADGVVSVGGLQNTVMATEAMKALPIGVPKVIATTIACGQKTFGPVVGERDIVVIPSICDFTGINLITKQIMANAAACCIGMVKTGAAGAPIRKGDRPVVGVTLMGVTNKGACSAIERLDELGVEALGFHATGVGGGIMEEMACEGLIDGILDMTTHELSEGHFGRGFSYDPNWEKRIVRPLKAHIPTVVCTGGLDFCDFAPSEFPERMDERVYMMHNGDIAHIKLLPEEAEAIAGDLADRLETAQDPVKLLVPTDGMRHNTQAGEELYDRRIDDIIIRRTGEIRNPLVTVKPVEGNLDTEAWGRKAADEMADTLRAAGILK